MHIWRRVHLKVPSCGNAITWLDFALDDIPFATEGTDAEIQDIIIGSRSAPSLSGEFHPALNNRPMSGLDRTGSDVISLSDVFIVAHPIAIGAVIAPHPLGLNLDTRSASPARVPDGRNDAIHSAGQKQPLLLGDPTPPFLRAGKRDLGERSGVLGHMVEIKNLCRTWIMLADRLCYLTSAVTEEDQPLTQFSVFIPHKTESPEEFLVSAQIWRIVHGQSIGRDALTPRRRYPRFGRRVRA